MPRQPFCKRNHLEPRQNDQTPAPQRQGHDCFTHAEDVSGTGLWLCAVCGQSLYAA